MRFPHLVLPALALLLASCGDDSELPPLAGSSSPNNERAEALFSEAQAAEGAGKRAKAIKLYDTLGDEMPLSRRAPEARFRQGELLQEEGRIKDSFDAYQELLVRYNSSNLYTKALDRQAAMAQSAAEGQVKTSFLGLKSKLSNEKVVEMLEKVSANAPRSPTASKAEFTIGQLWESQQNSSGSSKAIAAYRDLVIEFPDSKEAPEAQFRIGKILLEEARRGNQDQANLDRARESLQDYLRQYPGHSKNGEARQLLANLGGEDVQRSYNVAEFYERKGDTESAKFYYEEVLRKAKSGELHDKAKARLAALGGS
jgi:outer membrane protein assembly factor BamD (BamD/ComL family)